MAELKAQIAANKKKIQALEQNLNGMRDMGMSAVVDAAGDIPTAYTPLKAVKKLTGHFGKIYAMDWGPSQEILLSGAQDGTLIIWNALKNTKVNMFDLASNWLMTCAMSSSGNLVASGGLDNTCTIHATAEGKSEPQKLVDHAGYLSGAAFLDDQKVITSSGDSTCKLWDIDSGKVLQTFEGHQSDVMGVQLIPDSPHLVLTGSCDTTCKIWDHREQKANVLTFPGHKQDVNTVDCSSCGNFFVSGGDDSTIILHDIRSYGPLQRYSLDEDAGPNIASVCLSRSSRLIYACYEDTGVEAWDVLGAQHATLIGSELMRVSCLGVNKQGNALATGGWDNTMRVWA